MKKNSIRNNNSNKMLGNQDNQYAWLVSFSEFNPRPLIELEEKGEITYVNQAAKSQIPRIAKITNAKKHPFFSNFKMIEKQLRNQQSLTRELRVGERWFRQAFYRFPQFRTIRVYASDVTEQKRIEGVLSRSRESYWSLFNKITEGHAIGELVTDRRGKPYDIRLIDCNPAFEEISGLPRMQTIGKTIRQIFPRASKEVIAPYLKVAASGKPAQFEQHLMQTKRWYNAFVYKTADRQIAGLFLDITRAKRIEAERNKFISIMAHEIRNPLASILAAAQLMRRGLSEPITDQTDLQLKMIERQSKNMAKLLDDILDTSRMSRQKIVLEKQVIDVNDLVRLAAADAAEVSDQKRQTITIQLPKHPIYLYADPLRIEQILGNLINNAVKYTQEGGRIQVSIKEKAKMVEISVQDNGQGISREKMRHIFTLFHRTDAMPFSAIGSLGIGLNITKRLAHLHHGAIKVRSEGEGKGSIFMVSLPKSVRQSLAVNQFPEKKKPKSSPQKMRVMVVDDNRDIARLITDIFSQAGHETLTVHDGRDAIQKAKAFKPQAAIIDIGLPSADGYQVAKEIRRQAKGNKVKLVALTGYGQENDRQKSKEAGFNLHLVKPVDIAQFTDLL